MLAKTFRRVENNTPPWVNRAIRRQTERNIERYRRAGPMAITWRLEELEGEWDIERVLETNASSLILLGLGFGTCVNKRWLLLPTVVAGFLLQHALQGWCPPIGLLRRLGVRTAAEIGYEAAALRALRGDFDYLGEVDEDVCPEPDADDAAICCEP
uniref:DUF2892 domain-containing protein n=1 Tax=Desulfovibrio sp. U5L TaxID=596152 RepID=I2PYR2_9BACT